jgi:DAPG hydrolase PhiG domain
VSVVLEGEGAERVIDVGPGQAVVVPRGVCGLTGPPHGGIAMTSDALTRREVLGAAATLAGLSLAAAGCDGSRPGNSAAGAGGIALVRAELGQMVETYRLPLEAGYRTLEDGMKMVASIHHVPNLKGAMVEWLLRRLFLGDFDPAPSPLMRSVMLRFLSDERARWLMRHQSEEYVYLSQFLPALYEREA